ncbi:hypothetical protein DAI22_04g089600 [Oryza sativa Japonica Group]|nr:hypothetical protein DAI22_04g089600 [Oryza sativa Japonica Group]
MEDGAVDKHIYRQYRKCYSRSTGRQLHKHLASERINYDIIPSHEQCIEAT